MEKNFPHKFFYDENLMKKVLFFEIKMKKSA